MGLPGFRVNSQLILMHMYESFEPFFCILGDEPRLQEPERKDIPLLPLEKERQVGIDEHQNILFISPHIRFHPHITH